MYKPILKWLALLILFLAVPAHADTAYEVYTYGDTGSYRQVFEAVAAMSGQDSYRALIKTCLILAVLVMLFGAAWFNLPGFINWFVQAMVVFTFLISPVATVAVVDKYNQSPPYVVSNVPVTLAVAANLITKTSYWMTDKFESLLSVPGDIRVSQTGYRFGQKALSLALTSSITAEPLNHDLTNYVRDCVIPEVSRDQSKACRVYGGTEDPFNAAFSIANPMLITNITGNDGTNKTVTCTAAATGDNSASSMFDQVQGGEALATRVAAEAVKQKAVAGKLLAPHLTNNTAAANNFDQVLDTANTAFLNSTATADDVFKKALFANFWAEANPHIAISMNNGAEAQLIYAQTQAQVQAIQSYKVQGRLAEDTLPRFRNMIELITIFLFPLVVLGAVVAGHKAIIPLRGWFMSYVWVALWPPLYAVANFFAVKHDAASLNAWMNKLGSCGDSSLTADILAAQLELAKSQSDAAMLVYSIPVIAAAIAKGFDMAGSGFITGAMTNLQKTGAQVGGANAMGNEKLMQGATNDVSVQAQGSHRTTSQEGVQFTTSAKGEITSATNTGAKIGVSSSIANTAETASASARDAAMKFDKSFENVDSAKLSKGMSLAKTDDAKVTNSDSFKSSVSADEASSFKRVQNLQESLKKSAGLTEGEAFKAAIGTPGVLPFQAKIDAAAAKDKKLADELAWSKSGGAEQALKYASAYSSAHDSVYAKSGGVSGKSDTTAALDQAVSAKSAASASWAESEKYSTAAKAARSAQATIERDGETMLARTVAERLGGGSVGQKHAQELFGKLRTQGENGLSSYELDVLKGSESQVRDQMHKQVMRDLGIDAPTDNTRNAHGQYVREVGGKEQVIAQSNQNFGQVGSQLRANNLNPENGLRTQTGVHESRKEFVQTQSDRIEKGREKGTTDLITEGSSVQKEVNTGLNKNLGDLSGGVIKRGAGAVSAVANHEIANVGGVSITPALIGNTALIAGTMGTGGAVTALAGMGRAGAAAAGALETAAGSKIAIAARNTVLGADVASAASVAVGKDAPASISNQSSVINPPSNQASASPNQSGSNQSVQPSAQTSKVDQIPGANPTSPVDPVPKPTTQLRTADELAAQAKPAVQAPASSNSIVNKDTTSVSFDDVQGGKPAGMGRAGDTSNKP